MNMSMELDGERKHDTNGARINNMANGFIVIYTVLLGEAMNNPSCCEL
jgi:hypothetical protein